MIDKIMGRVAWSMSLLGAFVLLLILVTTIADVFASKVLGTPFPGATELVMSVMPITVCAFLLSVQIQKRHISIDILIKRLTPLSQVILQLLIQPWVIFLFGLVTYLTIPMAIHSVSIAEHTGGSVGVPIYPAKVMIPLATGLVTIQLLLEFFRTLMKLKNPVDEAATTCEIIDDSRAKG
jgi:TRAP-type mannitol/chloroaromatic compound transport system permease small subunit